MKFNIDNLFRTKLNEVSYSFKPEYWDEMEEKLNKECGGGTAGGFFGSSIFYKTAIIFTLAIVVGIISFFYFGNNKEVVPQTEIEFQNPIVHDSELNSAPNNSDSNISTSNETNKIDEESTSVTITKTRETSLIGYYKVSPTICELIGMKLDKELDEKIMRNLKPYTIGDDPLDYEDEIIFPEEVNKPVEEPVVKKKTVKKPDVPKNIKPMEKPVKHVFRKRKGLLWYLGFRR